MDAPGLVDQRHGHAQPQPAHKGLGLAPGRAVAHGHGLGRKPRKDVAQGRGGLFGLPGRPRGIHRRVVRKRALGVQHGHLGPGAEPRIQRQHPLLPQRRGQQERPQIVRKHLDSLGVGALLDQGARFVLHGRRKQPLVPVLHRRRHLAGIRALTLDRMTQHQPHALLVLGAQRQ